MLRMILYILTSGAIIIGCQKEKSSDTSSENPQAPQIEGPFSATIEGDLFKNSKREIQYFLVDKEPVFEGDIYLDMKKINNMSLVSATPGSAGLASRWSSSRWPQGLIPFVIQDGLSNRIAILTAIQHFEEKTPLQFVERSNEQDYITFRSGDLHCWSSVGRVGGEQFVTLSELCDTGTIIHELGHAVGMFHEQNRADRDSHIKVLWDNIDPTYRSQFNKSGSLAFEIGNYDDKSIMHYRSSAFSKNGEPTILNIDGSWLAPNQNHLSLGDIASINEMYEDFVEQPDEDSFLQEIETLAAQNANDCNLTLLSPSVESTNTLEKNGIIKIGAWNFPVQLSKRLTTKDNSRIVVSVANHFNKCG